MVDRKLVRSNTAGPQHSPQGGCKGASWWSLDLGPSHRLACNYYTLRHDASVAYLRHWVLQVSSHLTSDLISYGRLQMINMFDKLFNMGQWQITNVWCMLACCW